MFAANGQFTSGLPPPLHQQQQQQQAIPLAYGTAPTPPMSSRPGFPPMSSRPGFPPPGALMMMQPGPPTGRPLGQHVVATNVSVHPEAAMMRTTGVQRVGMPHMARAMGPPVIHEKEVAGTAVVRTVESAPHTVEAVRDVIVGPTVYIIQAYHDEHAHAGGCFPHILVEYGEQSQRTREKAYEAGICDIHDFVSFCWKDDAMMRVWLIDEQHGDFICSKAFLPEENPRGRGDHRVHASTLPSMPFPPADTWLGDIEMFDQSGNPRGVISLAIFIGQEVMGRIHMANPQVNPKNPFAMPPPAPAPSPIMVPQTGVSMPMGPAHPPHPGPMMVPGTYIGEPNPFNSQHPPSMLPPGAMPPGFGPGTQVMPWPPGSMVQPGTNPYASHAA